MVNVQRLTQELNFITKNSKHHDQATWLQQKENECGATGCLAGWAALHHAREGLEAIKYNDIEGQTRIEYHPANGDSWWSLGADVLGLTGLEAEYLFSGSNTIWDLWHIASLITDGAIQIPDHVEDQRNDLPNVTDNYQFLDLYWEDFADEGD